MEKILTQVLNLICNKSPFTFAIDENLAFELNYNNGSGKAKLMLDATVNGARKFVDTLINHKNKISEKIAPVFFEICKAENKIEIAPAYTLTKNKFYFDKSNFELADQKNLDFTNENLVFGYEVLSPFLPDFLILSHPGTGGEISIVNNGKLITAQIDKLGKNKAEFITAFINKLSFAGAELFEMLKKIELEAQKIEIATPVIAIETAPGFIGENLYKITRNKFYFNAVTNELLQDAEKIDFTDENITFGWQVKVPGALENNLILWHPGTGFDISFVYKNMLFGTQIYPGSPADKLEAFIYEVEDKGPDMLTELEAAFND